MLFAALFFAQLFTLQHCATPTPPSGGARDTLGPVLVVEETTPNFQRNFRPGEIILTFDEWVEIDPKQQILISPPLELSDDDRPYLKRRSLVIPLQPDELRDSVTYVVNIGAAIKDLNEGNPTENLRFVFATGPVLDSATVSGTIVRDYTGEPVDNATFALFSNLADTAVTSENPTYFAQTDENGAFTVYNIRPGTYRPLALERNPSATNYFIDQAGFAQPLAIGFTDSLITVADGNNEAGMIQLSAVARPLRINAIDTTDFGRLTLTLSEPAAGVDLITGRDYLVRNEKDTINLYYTEAGPDTFVVSRNGIPADTVVFRGTPPGTGRAPQLVKGPSGRLNPTRGAIFRFNRPLASLDTTLVTLRQDTQPPTPFTWSLDSLYPGILRLDAPWETSAKYRLTILPGALTDQTGGQSQDTIQRTLTIDSPDRYGTLKIHLINLDSSQAYILQLLEKEEIVDGSRRLITNRSEFTTEYPGFPPGTYRAEIITDANRNGRYDAGDFFLRRQPETVRRFELDELRANWEVDEEINLGDK